jgi:hypothetical protein
MYGAQQVLFEPSPTTPWQRASSQASRGPLNKNTPAGPAIQHYEILFILTLVCLFCCFSVPVWEWLAAHVMIVLVRFLAA